MKLLITIIACSALLISGQSLANQNIINEIVQAAKKKNIIEQDKLEKLLNKPYNENNNSELNTEILNAGTIPASLFVAIAIIQSNEWTSEPHISQNNPYGLNCSNKCFIDNNPKEISYFNSINKATSALFDFINSSDSNLNDFKHFRKERSSARSKTSALMYSSYFDSLNPEVTHYSYKLRKTIYINKLQKLDY